MSQANHCQAEETPTWQGIAYALKSLLCDYDIDLSKVGTTQRLQYEDFETIFYHLFVLIDPIETKRRFRLICAARNQEERAKFIESSVRFINDKQLHPQRISSSQLRMFGGEPFRRLLKSLIKAAAERELDRHELGIEEQVELHRCDGNLDNLLDYLNEKINGLSSIMIELNQSMENLRDARKNLEDSNQVIMHKWSTINDKLDGPHARASPVRDGQAKDVGLEGVNGISMGNNNQITNRDVSPVVRALLKRLGDSHSKTKSAIERIKAIELPREELLAPGESATRKRLSQFIREVANKFDTSHDNLLESHQTRQNEQIRQQLIDYDLSIDRLIKIWTEEEKRVDEDLLRLPEFQAIFAKLESLIPNIELGQIGHKSKKFPNTIRVQASQIEDILKGYPDPRYDDQEIIEATRKHFL